MVGERIADALEFIKRGIQRTLLHATFTHHVAEQRDTHVSDANERI